MKKLIIAFLIIVAAFFCSCLTENEPKNLFSVPISITATLEGNDAGFTAEILEKDSEIIFSDGHALSGTKIYFSEEGNTASVGDFFTRDIKNGTFPAQEALIKAVRLLSSADVKGVPNGERTRYAIDEMTIMVYYDENTDSITRIETEENGRRFDFSIVSLEPHDTQSNSDDKT